MTRWIRLLLFLLINALGFMSVGICYGIGVATGILDLSAPDFDAQQFKKLFINGTIMLWLICALFSTAFFFVKGRLRYAFLWAPVVVPMLYGLSVLYGSGP